MRFLLPLLVCCSLRAQEPPLPPDPVVVTNWFSVLAQRGDEATNCQDHLELTNGWVGWITWTRSVTPGASYVLEVGKVGGPYTQFYPVGTRNEVRWPIVTNSPDPVVLVAQWADVSAGTWTWHDLVTVTNDGVRPARFLRVGYRKASEGSVP